MGVSEDFLPLLVHQTTQHRRYVDLLLSRVRIIAFKGAAPPSHLPIVNEFIQIAFRSRSSQ